MITLYLYLGNQPLAFDLDDVVLSVPPDLLSGESLWSTDFDLLLVPAIMKALNVGTPLLTEEGATIRGQVHVGDHQYSCNVIPTALRGNILTASLLVTMYPDVLSERVCDLAAKKDSDYFFQLGTECQNVDSPLVMAAYWNGITGGITTADVPQWNEHLPSIRVEDFLLWATQVSDVAFTGMEQADLDKYITPTGVKMSPLVRKWHASWNNLHPHYDSSPAVGLSTQTSLPFNFRNCSIIANATLTTATLTWNADGYSFITVSVDGIRIIDTSQLSGSIPIIAPAGSSIVISFGGGNTTSSTYGVRLSWIDPAGEAGQDYPQIQGWLYSPLWNWYDYETYNWNWYRIGFMGCFTQTLRQMVRDIALFCGYLLTYDSNTNSVVFSKSTRATPLYRAELTGFEYGSDILANNSFALFAGDTRQPIRTYLSDTLEAEGDIVELSASLSGVRNSNINDIPVSQASWPQFNGDTLTLIWSDSYFISTADTTYAVPVLIHDDGDIVSLLPEKERPLTATFRTYEDMTGVLFFSFETRTWRVVELTTDASGLTEIKALLIA